MPAASRRRPAAQPVIEDRLIGVFRNKCLRHRLLALLDSEPERTSPHLFLSHVSRKGASIQSVLTRCLCADRGPVRASRARASRPSFVAVGVGPAGRSRPARVPALPRYKRRRRARPEPATMKFALWFSMVVCTINATTLLRDASLFDPGHTLVERHEAQARFRSWASSRPSPRGSSLTQRKRSPMGYDEGSSARLVRLGTQTQQLRNPHDSCATRYADIPDDQRVRFARVIAHRENGLLGSPLAGLTLRITNAQCCTNIHPS